MNGVCVCVCDEVTVPKAGVRCQPEESVLVGCPGVERRVLLIRLSSCRMLMELVAKMVGWSTHEGAVAVEEEERIDELEEFCRMIL